MGKKINTNSNVITNSNGNQNIHQIQNNNSKKEDKSNGFSLTQVFQQLEELKNEVRELKEQIKNNNS
jgi:hypothetical protein